MTGGQALDQGESPFAPSVLFEVRDAVWHEGQGLHPDQASDQAAALAAELVAAVPDSPVSDPAERDLFGLTEREIEVLRLVSTGLTNAEVAERLYLSRRTVDVHLHRIYSKLDVSTRAAATRLAVEHGLV